MLIAPELRNAMKLIDKLEKLESRNTRMQVKMMISHNGFIITPVGKERCVKLYVEENHHLLVVYMTQFGKYDNEEKIELGDDIDALASKIKTYLMQTIHVLESETCT